MAAAKVVLSTFTILVSKADRIGVGTMRHTGSFPLSKGELIAS